VISRTTALRRCRRCWRRWSRRGRSAWGAVMAYLQSADAQKLDHPWMIESSPLHKRFGNKPVASVTICSVAGGGEARRNLARLAASDDPRPRWSARQQISRIRANDLTKLASGCTRMRARRKKAAAGFAQKLDELDKSAARCWAVIAVVGEESAGDYIGDW
jgi:hypothetical protein